MNLKTTLIQICSICWIFRSKYLCGWRPNLHFNRHVHINSRQHRYLPPLAHCLVTDIEIHLRLLVKILPCCHVNFESLTVFVIGQTLKQSPFELVWISQAIGCDCVTARLSTITWVYDEPDMLHVSLPRVFKLKQAAGYIVHIQLSFGNKSQISALVKGEESALSNKCKVVATRTPLDLLD